MNIYQRIIENPLFYKWIYHPTEEINAYWEHYLDVHPEQAQQITLVKKRFEEHLKYRQEKLTEPEKKALAKRILLQIEKAEQKKRRKIFLRNMTRYAAIAFLFFLIGSSLVYLYMSSRQPDIVVENSALPAQVNDPVLFIGEEEQIQLSRGKSELEYSGEGEITLNRNKKIKVKASAKTPEMNTLVIPYGSHSEITLADGSRVWLNAGSRLIYPSRFVDKTREVFLSGEAFFEVAENNKHPFVVKTVDLKVKALGTRFNVSAYPEDYSVQTVLEEGRVALKETGGGLFKKDVNLEPGQLAYFNKKTKETNIHEVNVEHYTLWTEGLLSFSNTDFNRIIKKLERYYNIQFRFDDPMKGMIQITGKLDVSQDREEVLEYLSKITGLEFMKINKRHYMIK